MARNISFVSSILNTVVKQSTAKTARLFSTTLSVSNHPWKLGKLNHVAVAVADMEKSVKMYRDVLGATVGEKQPQHEHGVYTVFVELGDTKIELLSPLGKNSTVAKFLQKNPSGGVHHICLEVDDIRKAMDTARKNGIRVLDQEPKIGAHGKLVAFLHPKDCGGVLTELEEA